MKKVDYIGRVAEKLNIVPSTLRYWEKEGLIKFERNNENNYREISFQTIMNICDIIFYRELSIPVKKIKEFYEYDLDKIMDNLDYGKNNILKQIDDLQNTVEKINTRQKMIEKLKNLELNKFEIEKKYLSPLILLILMMKVMHKYIWKIHIG